jgi:hypothetical protein
MDYETTKNAKMEAYPSLYADEIDVLHHLFFVNGNGYEWINGELSDGSNTAEELIKHAKEFRIEHIKTDIYIAEQEGNDKEVEYLKNRLEYVMSADYVAEERKKNEEYRRSLIERGDKSCWYICGGDQIGRTIYPICQYARILHIPDDVKPDWLMAARKAIELTKTSAFRLTKEDEEWIAKAEESLKRPGVLYLA